MITSAEDLLRELRAQNYLGAEDDSAAASAIKEQAAFRTVPAVPGRLSNMVPLRTLASMNTNKKTSKPPTAAPAYTRMAYISLNKSSLDRLKPSPRTAAAKGLTGP